MTSERGHPHLLRGILLIMLAVFLFSAMDTLAKFALRSYPLGPLKPAAVFPLMSALVFALYQIMTR